MNNAADTIFAVASGAGRTAVAVVRLSGPAVRFVVETMIGRLPLARHAKLAAIRSLEGRVLDRGLVLWFPGPASFTGEDCVELQLHGGRAIVAAVLACLGAMPGLRAAEPGEFTRRAFLNGRLDLAQVEGLADLIDSETELQRRQAMRQFERGLSGLIESWREALLDASALIEAEIDFADEADVPESTLLAVRTAIAPVIDGLQDALRHSAASESLREGYVVVIAGAPNAGKSSLMNWIAQRQVAIVSEHAGTTRDLLEVCIDIGGVPILLVDSAGLRETTDPVERQGVERAKNRAQSADLILWLSDLDFDISVLPDLRGGPKTLKVLTKADVSDAARGDADFTVSAVTGEGIDDLLAAISHSALDGLPAEGTAVLTRERHRLASDGALAALLRADGAGTEADVGLVAEDIRLALHALGSIIGKVDVEEILGEIFSRFCIGK